jgi:hypothetical protein
VKKKHWLLCKRSRVVSGRFLEGDAPLKKSAKSLRRFLSEQEDEELAELEMKHGQGRFDRDEDE